MGIKRVGQIIVYTPKKGRLLIGNLKFRVPGKLGIIANGEVTSRAL